MSKKRIQRPPAEEQLKIWKQQLTVVKSWSPEKFDEGDGKPTWMIDEGTEECALCEGADDDCYKCAMLMVNKTTVNNRCMLLKLEGKNHNSEFKSKEEAQDTIDFFVKFCEGNVKRLERYIQRKKEAKQVAQV